MNKALILGNYNDFMYHDFHDVDKKLTEILKENFVCTCTEEFDILKNLSDYQLLISYADIWESSITNEQLAAIIQFVVNGGGLLAIHNGISLQNREEFIQLIGGKFTEHPLMETIKFVMKPHSITTSIEDFELMEEPYQFEFDYFSKNDIFLEYLYQGKLYPAGWSKTFGLGKLVYLTPGHTKDAFDYPMYQKLIVNSARWVIHRGNYEKIR